MSLFNGDMFKFITVLEIGTYEEFKEEVEKIKLEINMIKSLNKLEEYRNDPEYREVFECVTRMECNLAELLEQKKNESMEVYK